MLIDINVSIIQYSAGLTLIVNSRSYTSITAVYIYIASITAVYLYSQYKDYNFMQSQVKGEKFCCFLQIYAGHATTKVLATTKIWPASKL